MVSQNEESTSSRRWIGAALLCGVAVGAVTVGACSLNGTKKAKEVLSRYGTIEAEWQIRDEEAGETYSYVMIGTESGRHETYEIVAKDGRQETRRELAGGIDANGCYITAHGMTTRWISGLPAEALEDAEKSPDETRTACLEYKDKAAWQFVPAEDKKAAEPPPPPPKNPSPDAGSSDAGGSDTGMLEEPEADEESDVDSALPL